MVLQEMKDGKLVIIEGIVHTLTPLNNIQDLEDEARKEVEAKVRSEMASEQLIRELGRAGEFFTENNWRYYFIGGDTKHIFLAAPFEGGVMTHKKGKREFKVYVPNGWLGLDMTLTNFPNIESNWRIVPRITTATLRGMYNEQKSTFAKVHPHCFNDGRLCGGMNPPHKFELNTVVQMIKDCIIGSKKEEGTSVWDYNELSPATNIGSCTYGKMAYILHKEGKNDDEVWGSIMKAKIEKKNMSEYTEERDNE